MSTIYVSAILVAALWAQPKNRLANRLLGSAIACSAFRQFVLAEKLSGAIETHPHLFRSTFPTSLLAISLFFFYVRALTTCDFTWRRGDLWHLMPFAFGLAWYALFLIFAPPTFFHLGPEFLWERFVRLILKVLVAIPYLIASYRYVLRYEAQLKEHQSTVATVRLSWLKVLVTGATVITAADLADILTGPMGPLWNIILLASCAVTLLIGAYSLYHSAVFAQEHADVKRDGEGEESANRLSPEQLQQQTVRLVAYLDSEKPYLNPTLRLSDLADALAIKPYRLSEVINRGLQTTFFNLINGRRVEHAKRLARDPKFAHMNLMGIALESGFNSKSVFNEVFKAKTGTTPSQFRTSGNA